MAHRRPPRIATPDLEVPESLRAGCCVEIWDPDHPYVLRWPDYCSVTAGVRFRRARAEWLRDHGLSVYDPLVSPGAMPWSYLESKQAGTLAADLEARGLPSDWEPTPIVEVR